MYYAHESRRVFLVVVSIQKSINMSDRFPVLSQFFYWTNSMARPGSIALRLIGLKIALWLPIIPKWRDLKKTANWFFIFDLVFYPNWPRAPVRGANFGYWCSLKRKSSAYENGGSVERNEHSAKRVDRMKRVDLWNESIASRNSNNSLNQR